MKLGVHLNAQHPQARQPWHAGSPRRSNRSASSASSGFDSASGAASTTSPTATTTSRCLPLLQRLVSRCREACRSAPTSSLLPMHNPMEIAEVSAFLDVITGGNFQLGVGLGYRPEEFDMFGVPIKQRVSRMVEGVEIIRRLWTEDNVTHHGRHWQFENMTIRPQPAQQAAPADHNRSPGRRRRRARRQDRRRLGHRADPARR